MSSQFIEQIQILMQAQQIKCAESVFGRSNYTWLCSKRIPVIWMSPKDEFFIRQALPKVSADQQVKIMKQLLTWLDNNPEAHSLKLPEMCLRLLNRSIDHQVIQHSNLTRIGSIRDSLRRSFSFKKNKDGPRSVTFNDKPIIYQINN